MKLAIGVVTYNRRAALEGCLAAVAGFTREPHALVVADDGSTDGTSELLRGRRHVTGENRGLGWNRNRALYWMMTRTTATHFLILEDDCWPCEPGWEREWMAGIERWGHLTTAWSPGIVSGAGTAESPFLSVACGTQCVGVSRAAVLNVGYSDSRFLPPYGHEDTEWRWRFGRWNLTIDGNATLGLHCGVEVKDFGTYFHADAVKANGQMLEEIRHELPLYRHPWRTTEENIALTREMMESR